MDRDARCWVTNFSQPMDLMLLHEIFQTPFSNNSILKIITYRQVARQKKQKTLHKQVVVEYLQVWFR